MLELLANPLVWKVLICYWIFSAAVGALPTPEQGGAQWYMFLFRFSHGLAGNVTRAAIALKVPGSQADDAAKP